MTGTLDDELAARPQPRQLLDEAAGERDPGA